MRRSHEAVSLFPFLSVLAAALGTLTLIVSGMAALNFSDVEQNVEPLGIGPGKNPRYVECRRSGLLIHPEGTEISLAELREKGPWEDVLDDLEENADEQFLILLVRPGGLDAFRLADVAAGSRGLERGYDPVYAAGPITVASEDEL